MKIRIMIVLVCAALLGLLSSCSTQPDGWLEGKVTVGPLTPVQRTDQPEPTPRPEVFASRGLLVDQPGSLNAPRKVALGPDGSYKISLPPGKYRLSLDQKNSIEHATVTGANSTLPVEFEIRSNQATVLNLDIDTGIR